MSHPGQVITAEGLGRRQQRRYELRRSLRDAAWRLVEKHGYDAVTVEDIATEAGTSVATFYRNFGSKESVLTRHWLSPERLSVLEPEIDREHGLGGVVRSLLQAYGEMVSGYSTSLLTRIKVINQDLELQMAMTRGRAEDQEILAEMFADVTGQPVESLAMRLAAALTVTARATAMARWADADGECPLPQLLDDIVQVLAPALARCEEMGQPLPGVRGRTLAR